MRPVTLLAAAIYAFAVSGEITWQLFKASSPTADDNDAYPRIEKVVTAAVARHTRINATTSKALKVYYQPGVPTAEGSYNGDVRFGSDRSSMTERCALHEIGHTLGIGGTKAFDAKCAANDWPTATKLLQSWDGPDANISCGGHHFWPYGLNYDTEWSETNADRNVMIIDAMIVDGLQSY